MKKRLQSLLVQYLAVVLAFLVTLPVIFATGVLTYSAYLLSEEWGDEFPAHYTTEQIEENAASAAHRAADGGEEAKRLVLEELWNLYPDAELFWVDGDGQTHGDRSERWTVTETVQFMKASYGGDPYTVVKAFGESEESGFLVIRVPRDKTYKTPPAIASWVYTFVMVLLVASVFLLFSWLFFSRIRKRLLALQRSMSVAAETGLPIPLQKEREPWFRGDEISELERSFNRMAVQVQESRAREKEEEELRKGLIASLSHDLRTPLTTLRGHAYRLQREELSEEGRRSLGVIDEKISFVDRLIDNLLSFTLLSAGRLPFTPERKDAVRLLRSIVAAWYPVLEKDGFEIDVDLPDEGIWWEIDVHWFQRIWDNLLQNVIRHAKSGGYVAISAEDGRLVLEDRGPGLQGATPAKGAGVGLEIVALMVKEMGLHLAVESGEQGTRYVLGLSADLR